MTSSARLVSACRVFLCAMLFAALAVLAGCGSDTEERSDRQPSVAHNAATNATSEIPHEQQTVAAQEPPEFSYTGATLAESENGPEICFDFTQALDASGNVSYQDYIRSAAGLTVSRIQAQRMCLTGGKAGDTIAVTLRAGLPAASGDVLASDAEVSISLRNLKPSVNFERGFVLPRGSARGLPVTTVNTENCWLAVLRMPPHAITQVYGDILSGRRFNPWDVVQLNRTQATLAWNGTMQVVPKLNEPVTTLFPVRDVAIRNKPGLYFIIGSPAPLAPSSGTFSYEDLPEEVGGQLVLETDLALTTYQGTDGMTVSVRSYATAQPVSGVTLTLISRNLEELGTAVTDRQGMASFAAGLTRGQGAAEPVLLTAAREDDTALLDLRGTPLDLSDRGIEGRTPIQGVDAYLYTDRGVYRPRETVNLMAMLRTPQGAAVTDAPLTVTVVRPDGKIYRRTTVQRQEQGAAHLPVHLSETALRGRWQATAHIDPQGPPVGEVFFQVEDFVPERLAVSLHTAQSAITPQTPAAVAVQADFLYGAPGNGLQAEAETTLRPDPAPFKGAYAGYLFGDVTARPLRMDNEVPPTDETGKTALQISLADLTAAASARRADTQLLLDQPALADITVRVQEPGGRTTRAAVSVPVLARKEYIGLRPLFRDGYAPVGQPARFEAVCVDAGGRTTGLDNATVTWKRISVSWQWSRTGGSWRYERVERVAETRTEPLAVTADAPARISRMLDWGRYQIEISAPGQKQTVAYTFNVGWGAETDDDRPDRLDVRLDSPLYKAGSQARLHIDSPVAGKATVVIANERVLDVITADIPAGGGTVDLPVRQDWGAGAYALVTLHQPLQQRTGRSPVRAVGVSWIPVDMAEHTLAVSIASPERIRPRSTVSVPVRIQGGAGAHVTLAAVDEGILQLTRFSSPSPDGYFFAKRRLGVTMRDDYGRLIEGEGTTGTIRQGGDMAGASGSLEAVPLRIVSLFSGVVTADSSGLASIPLEIPEFQGRLRLMAVAWNTAGVGSASAHMTVRDPLVQDIILPRFLAPQDTAQATVLLHNLEAAEGTYTVTLAGNGTLSVSPADLKVTLKQGQRVLLPVTVSAQGNGQGSISALVQGPEFRADLHRDMTVRPAFGHQTVRSSVTLDPGSSLAIDTALLEKTLLAQGLTTNHILKGTLETSVQAGSVPGADVPSLLRWLDRYPYGCLEQTASRAMPLLYLRQVAAMSGLEETSPAAERIRDAIDRIGDMQNPDGSLNMWPGDTWRADPWTTVYAMDFLTRAALEGHNVPEPVLDGARKYLTAVARSGSYGASPEAMAYAYRVLAQSGVLLTADMRYFHDSSPQLDSTGWASLGRAFDLVGDRPRAASSFDRAGAVIASGVRPQNAQPAPYGTGKRNLAFAVAAAAESGRVQLAAELLQRGGGFGPDNGLMRTTTQEAGWKLLAVHGLLKEAERTQVTLDGRPVTTRGGFSIIRLPESAFLQSGGSAPALGNAGEGIAWVTTAFDFALAAPRPAVTHKSLSLKREYLTFEGQPVDTATVRRNDRFIVRLTLRALQSQHRQIVVQDLLPAGLEVETIIPQNNAAQPWLKPTAASLLQRQDDRVVAVYDFERLPWNNARGREPLVAAYIVRAVTAGSFTIPPASAEDMYDPQFAVRGEAGSMTIAP